MKVDIVACYYRQAEFAPFFWWGMVENKEHINQVFIVNDEPWDLKTNNVSFVRLNEDEPELNFLEHPHDGYGVAKSLNQGIRASSAEYVFTMSFDQILAPNAIASALALADPDVLTIGAVHTIDPDTRLEDLPHPRIIRQDYWATMHKAMNMVDRRWMYARNGHTLIPREAHKALGGFNEDFTTYGLEDYEYGARWIQAYGPSSVRFGQGISWHFGDPDGGLSNRAKKLPGRESNLLLVKTLGPMYDHRYALFAEFPSNPIYVRVGHEAVTGGKAADLCLDCVNPTWLPSGCFQIRTVIPNEFLTPRGEQAHLRLLIEKLRPGGSILVEGGPSLDWITPLATEHNLIIDMSEDFIELVKEDE